jgi:hypothetical protein
MADEADHLYALPLEEFIAQRDAAAKALRRAGDRDAANSLAKLQKPTPAAWAANQVARTEPDVLDQFLAAGGALREAQEAALAGDASRLREATKAQRAAVEAFMEAAQPLKPAGRPLSRAMSDRLRTTLLAAAGNEELSDALADGRLALEAEAGGAWPPPDAEELAAGPRRAKTPGRRSGAADGESSAPARRPAKSGGRQIVRDTNKRATRAARAASERDEAAERERAEAKERERAEREAAKQARQALERELREARGALKVRERALIAAEKDARRAAHRLDVALAEAEDARVETEAMQKLLAEAREAVDSTRDEVARLGERLD